MSIAALQHELKEINAEIRACQKIAANMEQKRFEFQRKRAELTKQLFELLGLDCWETHAALEFKGAPQDC